MPLNMEIHVQVLDGKNSFFFFLYFNVIKFKEEKNVIRFGLEAGGSEDCLFLNVYTQSLTANRPVMV